MIHLYDKPRMIINPYVHQSSGAFEYFSAIFDGTNDYIQRGAALTGIADGKQGTLSFWIKSSVDSAFQTYIHGGVNFVESFSLTRGVSDRLDLICRSSSSINLHIRTGNTQLQVADGWSHVISSWDLSTAATTQDVHLYIDDTDIAPSVLTFVDSNIRYTSADLTIGATVTGGNKVNGLMSEMYFTTEYVDLSVEANRRKFITAASKPADLGSDGSTPTGTAARVYQKNEVPTWHTNAGSGGGMTETGTLVDGGADIP